MSRAAGSSPAGSCGHGTRSPWVCTHGYSYSSPLGTDGGGSWLDAGVDSGIDVTPHRAVPESQRDSVPKPRVARHELPWVSVPRMGPTPTGLRPIPLEVA